MVNGPGRPRGGSAGRVKVRWKRGSLRKSSADGVAAAIMTMVRMRAMTRVTRSWESGCKVRADQGTPGFNKMEVSEDVAQLSAEQRAQMILQSSCMQLVLFILHRRLNTSVSVLVSLRIGNQRRLARRHHHPLKFSQSTAGRCYGLLVRDNISLRNRLLDAPNLIVRLVSCQPLTTAHFCRISTSKLPWPSSRQCFTTRQIKCQ